MSNLQKHEVELLKKEIYLELRTLTDSSLNNFIFDLKQILRTNHLDKTYDIVFALLRDAEFCFQSLCYSLPIFSSIDGDLVAVNVQSTKQSLAKGFYISCTVLPNSRTSIYSHKMAIMSNNMLHFKEDDLASLSIEDLKNPKVDLVTRNIIQDDKLVNEFYPIYSGQKVSLQCLEPKHIVVDGTRMWCDSQSIHFIEIPKLITINNKTVMTVHVPQHFSMKLAEMTHDFEVLSQFSDLNVTTTPIIQEIVNYFETAQPIHWSFFTLSIITFCSATLLLCFCCYLKCPKLMSKLFSCCCKETCCLLKCFNKRVLEKTSYRETISVTNDPDEGVQMIDMNNIQQAQNRARIMSLNSNNANILPSAPNLSLDSNVSNILRQQMAQQQTVQPLASSAIVHQPITSAAVQQNLTNCKNGYLSCFCRKSNQQCRGPVQSPPF